MDIYKYITLNNEIKYGYKIFVDEKKAILSYECAGFNTYKEAQEDSSKILDILDK